MKKPFDPQFNISPQLLKYLMQIEKARGFLEAANLSPKWLKQMSQNALLLETHHTTHIEGTELTLEQSKKILSGKKIPGVSEHDIKEVKNYRDAFGVLSDYLKTNTNISEALIKSVHKELVKGVRGGQAKPGKYRDIQNYVGNSVTKKIIYMPPKPAAVPALMKNFVAWANQESDLHPVIKSGIIQFQFVHIHPFVDGNARTSRLLCAFYLYKSDYDFKRLFSISEYYDKDRVNFYNAIQSVRENNMDMTPWLEYFAKGLLFQMTSVIDIGKKVILKDALKQNRNLSNRQTLILEHILENGTLKPQDFKTLCNKIEKTKNTPNKPINIRTLQRDIKDLIDKKIIISYGATSKRSYSLKPSWLKGPSK